MPLHYHTEYCLGRLGAHVCRTRTGPSALVAILIDMVVSVVFGLIGLAFRLVWFAAMMAVLIAVAVLKLGWLLFVTTIRVLAELIEAPLRATFGRKAPLAVPKPAWAGLDDL